MACPDPEELARYADGLVTGPGREAIAAHVDGCTSCREVMVALVRDSKDSLTSDGPAPVLGPDGQRPKRGDVIGRYVVLEARGAGGMGLVLSAHDSQLDRKVALKLVRPDLEERGGAEKTRARLLREAQLMARVRHTNVVTVYDVGMLGERIFIAMELVDGVTLRAWLTEKPRSRDEVIAMFVQAGNGLAAAHSAGVVHRDFKPDNVLVDAAGAAHVTDFGIAWSQDVGRADALAAPTGEANASGVKGTPAYMALEQVLGSATDARTDQFAFCVALYEALLGARPFQGVERVAAPPFDAKKKLPARLEAALRRGLSHDPNARFPDMRALLRELQPASRRPAVFVVGAALAVLAAAAGTFALTRPASDCETGPQRLTGIWDAPRRAEIEQAFAATGAGFSDAAYASVAAVLDRRSAEWVTTFKTSCTRTKSDELRTRQRVCLDARLGELQALADLFTQADVKVVEHAAEAATRLKGAHGCLEGETLATLPLPADQARRAAIAKVRLEIAQSEVHHSAGQLQPAIDAARAAIASAKEAQYPPAEAEAWLALVEPLRDSGQYEEARKALDDAAISAEAGRHFEAQLLVAIKHVRVVDSAHAGEADTWIRRAEAALRETPRPELQAQLDAVVAVLRLAQRRTTESIARSAAARKFYDQQGRTAEALGEWHVTGLARRARGDAEGAHDELGAALKQYETVLGKTHPSTLHVRIHVAEAALDLARPARVLELLDDPVFEGHDRLTPSWAAARLALRGDALRMAGEWADALKAHEDALAVARTGTGGARGVAGVQLHLIGTLIAMERYDEADVQLMSALRDADPEWLVKQALLGEKARRLLATGEAAEALAVAKAAEERLRALLEDAGAPEHIESLLVAAEAAAAAKDDALARSYAAVIAKHVPEASVTAARARLRAGDASAAGVLRAAAVFPKEQAAADPSGSCSVELPPLAAKQLAKHCGGGGK